MPKLTIKDLQKIKAQKKRTSKIREGGEYRVKITVHMGTCGIAAGARKIMNAFIEEIEKHKSSDIFLTNSGCAGLCSKEPMATVELLGQAPVKYIYLDEEKVKEIFKKHVLGGNIVKKYALGKGSEKTDA
ncbi:MAG: (2Fe-2S) ferredoxin domain-containing protein [Acidobacteriota bacterium]